MNEKDSSSDEEKPQNNDSPKVDILAQVNIEDEEEEKSEDQEDNPENENNYEEKNSNPMASFLNIVNQTNQNRNNENNKNEIKNDSKEDEKDYLDENTIERNLLLECQREDEENEKKIRERELKKKLKKLKYYNTKDYFMLFMLFMASSLNFNYLSLLYVLFGLIFVLLIENLNEKPKKIKYFMEIFLIGYSTYALLFKIIIVILYLERYQKVIDNEEFLINLGVTYIHKSSLYYLFLNFSTEVAMILSSGYGIYVSFKCRMLQNSDANYRKMKKITIRQLILVSYISIILFGVFNISYLTLFYIILIQFCLLLSSLKMNEGKVKSIFKYVIYILLICTSLQYLFINILNIPHLQSKYLYQNKVGNSKKIYSIFTQIGINYSYIYYEEESLEEFLKKYAGYFFGVLSMLNLAFILGELKSGPDILSEEELKAQKMKEKIEKNKEINKNNYILNSIDEVIRVISISWIFYFRNFFSVGIFFVVFFSFYFTDRKKNRFLILYILLPMLFLTLLFSHVSNIDGLFENLEEDSEKQRRLKLERFAIKKYKYVSIQYLCGHIFYILLMFLINSLYYFPKVKEIIKQKDIILSKKNTTQSQKNRGIEEDEEDKIKNEKHKDAILPIPAGASSKSVDIANSPPKKDLSNDILYEDVYEDNRNSSSDDSSESDIENKNKEENPQNDENKQKNEKVDEINFRLTDLLGKYFFINIDKVTLVIMYLVSVHTVNIVHLILVIIFIMQIIFPKKMHYFYKIIISIFQLLFLVEFIIDLLKIYNNEFSKHKQILELFIVFSDDDNSILLEINIFLVVYCFYFQYRAYRNKYIQSLLENKKISLRNYIKNKFAKRNKDKEKKEIRKDNNGKNFLYYLVCYLNDFIGHLYIWSLVISFIFFSCYFEMNLIFLVKLIFFLISLYYYIVSVQTPNKEKNRKDENINVTAYRIINKIINVYCCINTLVIFLYQFLCKDFFNFKDYIRNKQQSNPFLLNLPNIGFTLYKEEYLYYNFLPYFMTCFIFALFKRKTKKILKSINNFLIIRKQTNSRQIAILKEKHRKEEEKMKKIKEEQNEFIQDKLYADKYNENEKEIYTKSHQLLKANIILIFTKCYWFFLFLLVGIIYSYYEISLSILIYIIIFGFYFIKMFHRIITKLTKYIKMKSYYISKVVRYSLIEDPKHYIINRRYRIISYRAILIYSFLYLILLYSYGLFDLFQHGCNESIFKGCDNSHSSLLPENGPAESLIKAFSFLLGLYIDMSRKKIIDRWWTHFVVTCILISDIYNQKLEENYRKRYDELKIDLQKKINENNVLEKYSRIIDYNILIKIGLTVAGIDLTPVKDKNNNPNFKLSLQQKFLRNPKEINKLTHKIGDNNNDGLNNLKTIVENLSRTASGQDDSDTSESKEIKRKLYNDEENNLDLNENSPGNEFLKNRYIKQFLKIFSSSNNNKQTLSLGNSKDRVMRFLKILFEELIIFLLICISLGKLSIWTFVYLIFTFYLISTKKTMWKFFILSCFIYTTIIIQSLFFLSNLSSKIVFDKDDEYKEIFDLIKIKIGFPWYQKLLNEKLGFFMGLGVSESQVHLLYLEFVQIVVIFFYLDMFSYSIYQGMLNLGEKATNKEKFNFESLNLKPSTIDSIKQMSDLQFQQYSECLKCFDMNIGKDKEELLKILKIKESGLSRISDLNENRKNKKKYNLEELKNPTLKELIYFRLVNKENTIGNFGTYKPLPKYLIILQEFLYMHFHCLVLILIIFLSIMIGRLISIFYVTLSLYYLLNSELLYIGEQYSYFTAIKKVLRIVILIDILIQGIYQTPFVSPEENDNSYKLFNTIGFIKVVDFVKKDNGEEVITINQSAQVFTKAMMYLLISLQILIYESNHFKRYYLVYLLENKNEFKRHSIINSFKFNNRRVKIFKKSLNIRQRSDQAMEDLKKVIEELNIKLKEIGGKLFEDISKKRTLNLNKESIDNILNSENNENNIDNDNNENESQLTKLQGNTILNAGKKEGILGLIKKTQSVAKEKNYLEVDEVKKKIKNMLYSRIIVKIYLFLHKHSASYRSIEEEEKDDFDIETIKGETKIKSIIENDVNRLLNITDLEHFNKDDLKSIELLFEAHFDKKKKIELEENRLKAERSKNAKRKFSNLYNLHKITKMDAYKGHERVKSEDMDILGFFKEKVKQEKEEREQFEEAEKIKEYREKYKFQQFEELLETNLFKKYLTKKYLFENLFYLTFSFIVHNFTAICYMIMILNHIIGASLITLFYPISIFCFALIEYPRPKRYYWSICLYYTVFIVLLKFFIQQKVFDIFLKEKDYEDIFYPLYQYKIGFKHHSDLFSGEFIKDIIFDILTLLTILINRNLLIIDGIWFKREEQIENIYEASERIAIYQTKTYENKIDAIKDLLLQYLYTPKEILNLTRAERNNYEDGENNKDKNSYIHVKHRFPFIVRKNNDPAYNEAKRGYFAKMFTKNRNEKPGKDFYFSYTTVMFLICLYILLFYTQMIQDKTFSKIDLDTTQFSGSMVLYLILHIFIIIIDRIIFVSQNRDNLQYEYIFYKRNEINQQGELLTEVEENELKSEISRNNKSKYKITNLPRQEIEKQLKKYNIVFIQKETFNYPLLIKYIMHIFTIIFNHIIIFFYFPIKGNQNLGIEDYCGRKGRVACNDFSENYLIWIFYLIYLVYMILSALQIKYGFYDIKRKSLFKKGQDEIFSNMGALFKNIPFLYEIKNAIDWTFTHTCLDLFQWNKFEAIYDSIFDTYCEKAEWDEKPIGERVSKKNKIGIGFVLSFGLIFIVIIPLLLFSSLNPTNKINNITEARMNVDLTLNYKNGVMKNYVLFLNERADSISEMFKSKINNTENYTTWKNYNYPQSIETRNFQHDQVQRIIFSTTSDRNWELANPHIENLIDLLDLNKTNNNFKSIDININFELARNMPPEAKILKQVFNVPIYTFGVKDDKGAEKILNLRRALKNCEDVSIVLQNAYSPPFRLTSGAEITILEDPVFYPRNIELSFLGCVKESENKTSYFNSYFTITNIDISDNSTEPIELHIFNDQISETTQGLSVITFYITFVLLVGSYVRDYLSSDPETITLDEMPHPKKIVDLCEGIKIARYGYDFRNEEYLYTILIELMRSPDYLKILTDSSLDHFKSRENLTKDDD